MGDLEDWQKALNITRTQSIICCCRGFYEIVRAFSWSQLKPHIACTPNHQINFHPPRFLSPSSIYKVNYASGGRRQGRGACFLKLHHLTWGAAIPWRRGGSLKCALHLFPPCILSRPMQLKMTGRANKDLNVHHRSDRWNKRLTGLKSSLAPQAWPPQISVQTRERWEIN